MRARLSKHDERRMEPMQQELARKVMHDLRVQSDEVVGEKGRHRLVSVKYDDRLLEVIEHKDGHWPPQEPVGATVLLDGEQAGVRVTTPSVSRAICRAILDGHINERTVRGVRSWPKPNKRPSKMPTGPTTGVEIHDDHVMVEGIRLHRWEKPGPLTPTKDDVTVPKGMDQELRIIASAIANNYPILLSGDTGTGKTTVLTYLAHLCNVNLVKVVGDNEYGPSLWIGHLHAHAGDTYWVDGDLPEAMRGVEGDGQTWLFVDELSRMLPDNTAPLIPVLERHGMHLGKLRLSDHPDPAQRMVTPHKDFRIVMAMNPFDADFVGTHEVDLAVLRRASMQLELTYPDLHTTRTILRELHPRIEDAQIVRIAQTAQKLRDQRKARNIAFPCSPDVLDTWAGLIPDLGYDLAREVTIINKASAEDRPRVKTICESV